MSTFQLLYGSESRQTLEVWMSILGFSSPGTMLTFNAGIFGTSGTPGIVTGAFRPVSGIMKAKSLDLDMPEWSGRG